MKSTYFVMKEQLTNLYLIRRLAEFQLRISNKNNYLGMAWELINPIMQIAVFWFIFGLALRSNKMMEGVPFIYWLIVGISMWFFINEGVLEGSKSIISKFNQVAKMNFPLSIIPSYVVFSKFYGHLFLLIIVMIICFIGGYHPSIYTFQLLLYLVYALILTNAIALVASTLSILVRDIHLILQALMRMVFFVSSILYLPNNDIVMFVMKLNPIYFLAEGYRAAILHHEWYFITHWHLTIYNSVLVILLYILGSIIHMHFRDRFADFM
ncbi:ABC transporter permease [Staphylococcus saprophyticus]|uniref:ABC transporter permease n=1 Tax=Staphylococcus saprophyticus TaxID=29385 RepID=UPI0019D18626|nr:ABC transporter permease [Staphylococcus saprophyticus]MBN6204685.1 ABC transporter permease [Staphylococcus saprophyticus]